MEKKLFPFVNPEIKSEEISKYYETNIENLKVFQYDPYLKSFMDHFRYRNNLFVERVKQICEKEKGIIQFSRSYLSYGIIPKEDGIYYKEWLPGAKEVYLFGDFNNWERKQYPMKKDEYGNWHIFLKKKENGEQVIPHNTKVKIHILNARDEWNDRIPVWIRYAVQNDETKVFDGMFWNPAKPYEFKNPYPNKPLNLKIYECHIGMAGIEPRVHTYKEFTKDVLPRVKKNGYNCLQIMALMEHAYYGSFGYHCTNFFAASSRFGTPDDLKELIDTAHGLGLYVLMDLVHSHVSANAMDGFNLIDGTDYQYFHAGEKGDHKLWDSKIFDYSKWEVMRFLLSNLAYWLDEFKFDGFRFDGITSMLYQHHGIGFGFSGDYHEYFSTWTDINAITIAEDVSGMPTLGHSIPEGGVGFDYRLAMSIPDKWIQYLKEFGDEEWNMGNVTFTLINRRFDEKVVAYCESHDQALVGDKTISMWVFDEQTYYNMSIKDAETLKVSRGMALHKMIRLITLGIGGDAYLNFMGNEFGHPEWIDFPRTGNNWSYHHCRRLWNLADDKEVRFHYLQLFDEAMINLEEEYKWLATKDNYVTLAHEADKIIIFERDGLLFVFNFHPTRSFEHYRVGTRWPHDHKIVLETDDIRFGGYDRLKGGREINYPVTKEWWHNRPNFVVLYIPCRTGIVLKPLLDK